MKRPWLPSAACAAAVLLVLASRPAEAQRLELTFNEGRVTVVAHDVTVRQLLDEWARVGKTVVVNADLLSEQQVSVQLDAVPEAQALERILQSASGYVARRRTGTAGPSDYGLILVLAESDSPSAIAALVADADAASSDELPMEPPPVDAPTEPLPPIDPDSDADPETDISSNRAVGRDAGAMPSVATVDTHSPDVSAEKLDAGRPDGARPGAPTAAVVPSPGTSMADAPQPDVLTADPGQAGAPPASPGAIPPTDANGRELRKPKP